MSTFLKTHPVLSYFGLTFAISWGGLLAVGPGESSDTAWQSDPRLPWLVAAMLGGPSVAGLLMTGVVSGRAGFRELFSRLLTWRVGVRWYAVALLAAPLVFTAVNGALSFTSSSSIPSLFTTDDKWSLLWLGIVPPIVVAFFEELGWTGFAIPRLRRRHAVLATGLIVGIPWGAWHLITNDFWIAGAFAGELAPAFFVTATAVTLLFGQLPAYRVLMVWVYDRTGSLLVAMLMHVSLAVCTFLLGTSATGMSFLIYGLVSAAVWWVVVAVVVAAPAIRAFIVRHAALSYYALVFVISWGGMLALVGPGGIPGTDQEVRTLMPLALVVLFAGPSLSGILMTAIVHGRAGLRDLVSRLLRWRVGARWYAIALLTGPLLVMAVLVPLSLFSFDFVPGFVTSDDTLTLLMFGIAWGLIGGGFLEELGWTGFAVPTLRLRHGALTTALIVGLLWGAWHFLIAFWSSSSLSGGQSVGMFVAAFLVFYIAALPAYRVLMVWVYDRTQSLIVAMLMHASLSASTLILQPVATGRPALIWNLILAVALWVVVAVVARQRRRTAPRSSIWSTDQPFAPGPVKPRVFRM